MLFLSLLARLLVGAKIPSSVDFNLLVFNIMRMVNVFLLLCRVAPGIRQLKDSSNCFKENVNKYSHTTKRI